MLPAGRYAASSTGDWFGGRDRLTTPAGRSTAPSAAPILDPLPGTAPKPGGRVRRHHLRQSRQEARRAGRHPRPRQDPPDPGQDRAEDRHDHPQALGPPHRHLAAIRRETKRPPPGLGHRHRRPRSPGRTTVRQAHPDHRPRRLARRRGHRQLPVPVRGRVPASGSSKTRTWCPSARCSTGPSTTSSSTCSPACSPPPPTSCGARPPGRAGPVRPRAARRTRRHRRDRPALPGDRGRPRPTACSPKPPPPGQAHRDLRPRPLRPQTLTWVIRRARPGAPAEKRKHPRSTYPETPARSLLKKPVPGTLRSRVPAPGSAYGPGSARFTLSAALHGLRVRATAGRGPELAVRACRAGWPAGQVASAQAPSRRARPLPIRLRRLRAAVRRLSQASFLAVPR